MRIVLLVLFLTVLQFNLCYDFSDYRIEFGKNYSTTAEFNFRKENFDQNYSKILLFNDQNNTYRLSVNRMTDWSQAEVDGKVYLIQLCSAFVQTTTQKPLRVSHRNRRK